MESLPNREAGLRASETRQTF